MEELGLKKLRIFVFWFFGWVGQGVKTRRAGVIFPGGLLGLMHRSPDASQP
jgi:hypothetical protein